MLTMYQFYFLTDWHTYIKHLNNTSTIFFEIFSLKFPFFKKIMLCNFLAIPNCKIQGIKS